MNQDEQTVHRYLQTLCQNICYEPNGNIPPDFSLDNRIGIEVRRLNQQYRSGEHTEGLEEQRIPLLKAINNEISKYPAEKNGENFWLAIQFRRGVGKLKAIKKQVTRAIKAFQEQEEKIPFTYDLSDTVTLKFIAKKSSSTCKYKIGTEVDMNRGGWIVDLYLKDMKYCIEEKEKKIQPYKEKYEMWWLLLVDHVFLLEDDDIQEITTELGHSNIFEKIILINLEASKILEI